MDNGGHNENGRYRWDQYKPVHTQWMIPQHHIKEHHALTMKQMIAIMSERDTAIQERNLALSKEKAALAERDMAILQLDAAIAERNSAILERDNAIAALEYHENTISDTCPPGCEIPRGIKHMHHQQLDAFPLAAAAPVAIKYPRSKSRAIKKASKPPKKKIKKEDEEEEEEEELPKQVNITTFYEWKSEPDMEDDSKDFIKARKMPKSEWKDQDLGLNQVIFDESSMPPPVCSCTGEFKQCYKWGNGAWQSACCTTTLSMYPLPVMPNKPNARIGGRKMSGSAFVKLLSRLAAEGHDLSIPIDLKDHWAKHGTNRFITIK